MSDTAENTSPVYTCPHCGGQRGVHGAGCPGLVPQVPGGADSLREAMSLDDWAEGARAAVRHIACERHEQVRHRPEPDGCPWCEIERLLAGGCARDQRLTQYCAAAAQAIAERDSLRAQLARRDALVERLRREAEIHAQEARSSEREACAREVCMYCDGRAPRYGPPAGPNRAGNYEHQHEESGRTVLCYASGIWSRHSLDRALAEQEPHDGDR